MRVVTPKGPITKPIYKQTDKHCNYFRIYDHSKFIKLINNQLN